MQYGEALNTLIASFKRMPGIGQRTAERLAFHLVQAPKEQALELAQAIRDVKERTKPCSQCYHLSEQDPCSICSDPRRDGRVICVVERPQDVLAMEKSGGYRGLYHVLLGTVSLLEGVDPEDLTMKPLIARVKAGGVQEVILMNPSAANRVSLWRMKEFTAAPTCMMRRHLPVCSHGCTRGGSGGEGRRRG